MSSLRDCMAGLRNEVSPDTKVKYPVSHASYGGGRSRTVRWFESTAVSAEQCIIASTSLYGVQAPPN